MPNVVSKPKNNKLTLLILIIGAIIIASFVYVGIAEQRHQLTANTQDIKIDGIYLNQPREINNFNLSDNHGNPFTKANLKGHWTMMFFGFTNCGYVCPTTMASLNKMYQSLQKELPQDKLPQIVMISVDPDRDSVDRMNSYVTSFNPNFIGARADISETIALEQQLHIAAAKMQTDGQGKNQYTINHSADILLFNPEGKLQAYLSFPHQPEQMVKDYKSILQL